ncbi:MAG: RDD family protein [Bdellovibrionota bacterium]
MDKKREPGLKDSKFEASTPAGFTELKKVIEEELGHADRWDDYSNAFSPLTDGLGLESPKKKEVPVSAAPAGRQEPPRAPIEQVHRVQKKFEALSRNVEKKAPPMAAEPIAAAVPPSELLPPPINSPSLVRRVLAGVIDQIFVFTLWLIAMSVTLKLLTGSFVGGVASSAILEESRFLQFAVLEFATIWVAYAVFCMGVLDMTFGMWVWGIRVGYMTQSKRTWILRKVLRTIFTFVFYAPILPVIFLVFVGKRGRNLLDALSGTVVYQSVVIE